MLYFVTGDPLAATVFWLEDLDRFVSGKVRPVHPQHQALVDATCASSAPRWASGFGGTPRSGRSRGGFDPKARDSAGIFGPFAPCLVAVFSAVQTLLTHHFFDFVVLQRRLIAEDRSLKKNKIVSGGRSQDPFLQSRQDVAREIHDHCTILKSSRQTSRGSTEF